MTGPQVEALASLIFKELPGAADLDAAVDRVREEMTTLGLAPNLLAKLSEAKESVQRELDSIEMRYSHNSADDEGRR